MLNCLDGLLLSLQMQKKVMLVCDTVVCMQLNQVFLELLNLVELVLERNLKL